MQPRAAGLLLQLLVVVCSLPQQALPETIMKGIWQSVGLPPLACARVEEQVLQQEEGPRPRPGCARACRTHRAQEQAQVMALVQQGWLALAPGLGLAGHRARLAQSCFRALQELALVWCPWGYRQQVGH